eukprot:52522-Pyramimonas_sp.AAC.1
MPPAWRNAVIKTLAGAWATHSCFQSSHECRFGCEGSMGSQVHYLSCPRFWDILQKSTGHPFPPDPLVTLGLINPSQESL